MAWTDLPHILQPSAERNWSHARLTALNVQFAETAPEELLDWTVQKFGSSAALATGFGPSGIVLMHMASRMEVRPQIFYLDTDLLFPETYDLRDQLEERLGLTITRVCSERTPAEQAEHEGPELWKRNPDRCCYLRKVRPLRRFLATKAAWITGIRRDQSLNRHNTPLVEWDGGNGVLKINPLAYWRENEVWSYIRIHDLPFNPLHNEGYPSIGCMPCTHPVSAGDDSRSGRWAGHQKMECGIHARPASSNAA